VTGSTWKGCQLFLAESDLLLEWLGVLLWLRLCWLLRNLFLHRDHAPTCLELLLQWGRQQCCLLVLRLCLLQGLLLGLSLLLGLGLLLVLQLGLLLLQGLGMLLLPGLWLYDQLLL